MDQAKQRRHPLAWFDARSVMLFAAITLAGAAVQAQTVNAPQPRSTPETVIGGTPTTDSDSKPPQGHGGGKHTGERKHGGKKQG